jgi:DNA-binding transcriptional MerR regulator
MQEGTSVTPLEAGRPYLSIGEVLNVLKEEFPDVTVSKIRFLESEGLIQPERTASGYRKFSDHDIERLRFILRLQRDHFLPLKVIRERLEELETSAANGAGQSVLSFEEAPPSAAPEASEEVLRAPTTGVSLSLEELALASKLSVEQLTELEGFGLLTPKDAGDGESRYDESALEAAKLSRELLDLGLEPRHLRMFRSSVDRWVGIAEQMVLPLIKQRNPDARRAAAETTREFVRVGNRLMQVLLREAMQPYT